MKLLKPIFAGAAILMASCIAQSATVNTTTEGAYTLVTSISGLQIGSSVYDVTFHRDRSFVQLWDALYFHGGTPYVQPTPELTEEPTFWFVNDPTGAGATTAGSTIRNELDKYSELYTDISNFGEPKDGFIVPNTGNNVQNVVTYWGTEGDIHITSIADGKPYVSFSPAAIVPLPAAFWLFGSGLVGLIGIARKKAA